jgi:hypothetical protein
MHYVNGFLKKMCIRDGTLDFIDIHKEFSKQGSAIKPLFDTMDVSGVHISSSGEEKLCEVFSKYLTALPDLFSGVYYTQQSVTSGKFVLFWRLLVLQ